MPLHRRSIAALAVAVPATLLAALTPAVPAAARMGPSWVGGPNYTPPTGTTGTQWRDVTAADPADVWAVGVLRNPADNPLAARWDGKAWAAAPVPAAPSGRTYNLTAVDAVAPGDVWAVGSAVASGARAAAALHYDGAAWTAAALPSSPIGLSSELSDVDMSATGGWAVGHTAAGDKPPRALILRALGAGWLQVPAPDGDATSTELSAVFAGAAGDAWAVGSQVRLDGRRTGLILHWDGVGWQEQAAPVTGDPVTEETFLSSVSASGPDDVWAVGRTCLDAILLESCRPVALHLTGGAWAVVPTNGTESELTEVITLSPTDAWAIGYTGDSPLNETDYAEHWNGKVFTPDATGPSNPGGTTSNGEPSSALAAATAIPGTGAIWAVGWTRDPLRGGAHVVHRD
jgi:hypothetical protein